METPVAKFYNEWPREMEKIKHELPDLFRAFGGLFQAAMKEGALSIREKELIAMSVALAVRCQPCMNLHVQKCLQAGASREQVLEAAAVVVMMQGGPGYTHVPEIIKALDHLESANR